MRIVVEDFYTDLEQRCLTEGCDFRTGPYSEQWHGGCPRCKGRLGFFRAFGTAAQRAVQVQPWQGRITR